MIGLDAAVDKIRADISQPATFESLPTFVNIRSELTAIDLAVSDHTTQLQSLMSAVGASLPQFSPSAGSSADFAATIAEAVARAIRKDGDDEKGWQGVAGSRLFTQRVKEYRGPAAEFASWAQTFKSNVPKPMREAVEWAEIEKSPITSDMISDHSLEKWNEEV